MSAAPSFQLPEIDPAAQPEFADGAGARAWLEDVPLANVAATQRQLLVREVSAREWRGLHQAYAHAEALGVSEQAVKDYLNRDVHESAPRIAYLRAPGASAFQLAHVRRLMTDVRGELQAGA